jgi:transcriptional regulator
MYPLNRNETILKLYTRGKKQSDIARMYGLTRQRISQIIKRMKPQEDNLTLY